MHSDLEKLFTLTSPEEVSSAFPSQWVFVEELEPIREMSTTVIGLLLNLAVENMAEGCRFLNVGVCRGFSLLAAGNGNSGFATCIGVDNFSQFGGSRSTLDENLLTYGHRGAYEFFEMDYLYYLTEVHPIRHHPIGVYFLDGNHSYRDTMLGLVAAEPWLIKGALVIVDDYGWEEVKQATDDFLAARPHCKKQFGFVPKEDNHPMWWNGMMVFEYFRFGME